MGGETSHFLLEEELLDLLIRRVVLARGQVLGVKACTDPLL
jgi:hypothetical protein